MTFDYFHAARAYLKRHGKPIAFYSDKHDVFRVNKRDAVSGDGMTQFGRALNECNIEVIRANAPQSKSRVERCFGALQDRLVGELRLAGVSSIDAGNVLLPALLADDHPARLERAVSSGEAVRILKNGVEMLANAPKELTVN